MNLENNKTFDSYRSALNLTNKINLETNDKYIALSNLSIYYIWKNVKKSYKKIILKYQLQHGMMNLNYLEGLIRYQIFKITLNAFLKIMKH